MGLRPIFEESLETVQLRKSIGTNIRVGKMFKINSALTP